MQNNNQAQQNRATQLGRLTEEDNKWINTRAAEMARGHSREQMQKIVDSMEPNVRASLNQKTIDPIIYHFRMQATKEFRMRQQQTAQAGMNMNANRMQTPNPAAAVPATQSNQTPFMGNIDQFRGQQEEGMRSQQEGQLVVPASTPNPNQGFNNEVSPAQQMMLLKQLRGQYPNASQPELKQMLMQRTREFHARQQAQRQSQMMQGQNLTNGMPQPRNMNMLNQPTNLAGDNAAQNIQRPASRPQSAQQANQPQAAPYTLQQIIQNFDRFPAQVQNVLNARPRSDWVGFIQTWQRRQKQQEQQIQQQQQMANNMQRSMSQQAQSGPTNQNLTQTPNPAFAGPTPMQASLSAGPNAKAMPNMTPQMQQQPTHDNSMQMLQQQQQQRQQQQMAQMRANGQTPQQQAQSMQENSMLLRNSMNSRLPPQVAHKLQQFYNQHNIMMPTNIPTWVSLRAWMQSHGGANPPQPAIDSMQINHAKFMKQQAQIASSSQGMQPQNNAGVQMQNLPQNRPGIQPSMPVRLNLQQLQQWKNTLPGGQNLSDQQAMKLWEEHQQKRQSSQHVPQQTSQVQNNAAAPGQRGPQSNGQQGRPASQNQAPSQVQVAGRPFENRKRPNQDDAPETTNGQQNKINVMNLTKEDIAKMPPAKQQQVLVERRNVQLVMVISQMQQQISKEVTRTPPITNMDQTTRQKITARLTDANTRKMLERFDNFLVTYMRLGGTQEMLRALVQHKYQLKFQYTPESWEDKTYQVADHFTMTYDNLDKILTTLTRAFQNTLRQTSQQTPDGQTNNQAQTSIPLTQENLNAAAQQAAQQQKAKGQKAKDGPPPAPTAERPPTQWPVPDRGHGTPKYANPGFNPQELKLPPKKKPRGENAASPVSQPAPQQPKVTIRCEIPGCTIQPDGFATEAELQHHINTIHKPEMESVKDPVGFLNSSLQQAFNLDETMRPKKAATGAKKMEKTPSQGSRAGNKTATASVMARTASQQAAKATPPKLTGQAPLNTDDAWMDASFSWDDVNSIFGPNDSGDVIPIANESQDQLDKTLKAFEQTEDYKRIFGEPESSNSSAKSKSPDQGSEPSLPENKQQKNQDPYHIDFNIDGTSALPELEGGAFDDLAFDDEMVMVDKDGTGSTSSFEVVDRPTADDGQGFSDDFDFGSWIQDDGTNDMNNMIDEEVIKSLETTTDWDELYAAGPAHYAAGSMQWNAVGKSGQEMRRQLGWPVEGAAGAGQSVKPGSVVA